MVDAVERGIKSELFTVAVDNILVHGNIIFMTSSCFIWLGVGDPKLSHMEVAMPSRFDDGMPITTTILDDNDESGMSNSGFIQRLSKRFSIQIFSSNNVSISNEILWHEVERRLVELLAPHYS